MNTIKTKNGFTIVELMIALALTGIILAAVYGVYTAFYKTSGSQDLLIEAQQNAKAGIAVIERDLINAGLNAGTTDVITGATTNTIAFIFRDPRPAPSTGTTNVRFKVEYSVITDSGINYLVRRYNVCDAASAGCSVYNNTGYGNANENEKIIGYVSALAFAYYDADGAAIGDTSTQTNRNLIRLVKVSLTAKTSSKLPTSGAESTVTLTTQVHLRNMGAAGTAGDTTAPDAPTNVAVRDPQICGKLSVKWTKSTAVDVAGYKIFYGTSAGQYAGSVSVSGCPGESGGTCTYTLNPSSPALSAKRSSDPANTNKYFIAMQAYDNSGNSSTYSPDVSGDPSPSNSSFDVAGNDSTVSPIKPARPATFTASDGPSDGQVSLTWAASTSEGVTGYRIYRSESAFSSYPIAGNGLRDELITGTSFTDTSSSLIGCRTYYYEIAAVNCDTTLVHENDAIEDGNNTKYISTDYTNATGDTAPPDTHFYNNDGANPTTPTLSVRAGWQRVNVTLTNPTITTATGNVNNVKDFKQTCVYVNGGADYPALDAVLAGNGCFSATTGQLVPDSSGIFNQSASVPAFWHDSMLVEEPGAPSLANLQTYSYKAVSLDYCGNTSTATAQDQTNLCGEDPAGKPDVTPVNPLNPSASSCSGSITVSWTAISSNAASPSSATNPWDLAGYRIARSTDGGAYELISGAAPIWCTGACSYTDAGVTDGHTYQYKISPTDCPYEKVNPSSATILADIASGTLKSESTAVITPGKIDRDEKTSAVQDSHMEILTGKDAISNTYDYYHNTVTMYFENTNAGTMTITGLTQLQWSNTNACLKKITIGGPPSTQGTTQTVVWDSVVQSGGTCTNPTGAIDFINKQILANDRHVPITFEFTKTDGTVDSTVGMRSDSILINLTVQNDSTSTATCNTYLTYSGSNESSYVPVGPVATSITQDKPSGITTPYEATSSNNPDPLSNPSVVSVGGGNNVNVTITVNSTTTDQTGNPIAIDSVAVGSESANVKLYYTTTATTVYQAPQYTGANYTAINMFKTAANTYSLHNGAINCGTTPSAAHATDRRIPAQSNLRVWYFIVVKDIEGNFDRAPEVSNNSTYYTAYTYDQGTFNVCSVTLNAPTSLTGTANVTTAQLSWTAPTQYGDGGCLDTVVDPISYKVYKGGVIIPAGDDECDGTIAGLSCNDTDLVTGNVYNYQVKAINSCAAPVESALTDITAVCIGDSGAASLVVSGTDVDAGTAGLQIHQGDSYNVTIVDCLAVSAARAGTVEVINTTAGFTGFTNTSSVDVYDVNDGLTITETGAGTGTFNKTIETTGSVTANKLLVAAVDTITVHYPFSSPQDRTIDVVADACANIPNAPTALNLFIDGGNDAVRGNSNNIHVRFTAPQANTDASNLSDLASYKLEVTKNAAAFATVTIPLSSCTSSLADPAAGATCDYTYDGGSKMKDHVWSFTVKAVDNCSTGGVESGAVGPLGETCTAATCGASY